MFAACPVVYRLGVPATIGTSHFLLEGTDMGFFDQRDAVIGSGVGTRTVRVTDAQCPTLAEAMAGPWDADRSLHVAPQYGLSLWMEGSVLKCCLRAGDSQPRWFATLGGFDCAIERIEEMLKSGKGEWRRPKQEQSCNGKGK
jgi:hypothetical protein